MTTLTHLQAEAALCLWEAMMEMRDEPEAPEGMDQRWTDIGTVDMRHIAIDLAPFVCEVYDAMPKEAKECVPYDWEVVPAILRTVRFTSDQERFIRPTVHEAAARAAELLTAQN